MPASGAGAYRSLLQQEAAKAGLPVEVADAVMAIESGYDPSRIGGVGEIGLMQVRPGTAAMLGFTGTNADLAKPETNIHFGVTYLARAWRLAGGDLCRALMKYRAGHGEEVMTPLSVRYCARAQAHLAVAGSPLARLTLPPAQAESGGAKPAPKLDQKTRSAAFWAAHTARVRAISARIERRWAMTGWRCADGGVLRLRSPRCCGQHPSSCRGRRACA